MTAPVSESVNHSNQVPLETKILDFLQLMQGAYEKEQQDEKLEEQSFKIQEIEEDADADENPRGKKCGTCQSRICAMVQQCNHGLECWTVYLQNPEQVYKFWYTGRVLGELMQKVTVK